MAVENSKISENNNKIKFLLPSIIEFVVANNNFYSSHSTKRFPLISRTFTMWTTNKSRKNRKRTRIEGLVVSEKCRRISADTTAEETLEKWKMLKDDNEESGHPRYDNPGEKQHGRGAEISICKAGNISR